MHPTEQLIFDFVKAHPAMTHKDQYKALKGKGIKFNSNLLSKCRKALGTAGPSRKKKKPVLYTSQHKQHTDQNVPTLVDIAQAAVISNTSRSLIFSRIKDGTLKVAGALTRRGGKAYALRKDVVEKWAATLQQKVSTPTNRAKKQLRQALKEVATLKAALAKANIPVEPVVKTGEAEGALPHSVEA